MRLEPSPVIELNRAVAVAMRDGPGSGLVLIDDILARGDLSEYHLAPAARADLCRRLGNTDQARAAYERAWVWPVRRRSDALSSGDWGNSRPEAIFWHPLSISCLPGRLLSTGSNARVSDPVKNQRGKRCRA